MKALCLLPEVSGPVGVATSKPSLWPVFSDATKLGMNTWDTSDVMSWWHWILPTQPGVKYISYLFIFLFIFFLFCWRRSVPVFQWNSIFELNFFFVTLEDCVLVGILPSLSLMYTETLHDLEFQLLRGEATSFRGAPTSPFFLLWSPF